MVSRVRLWIGWSFLAALAALFVVAGTLATAKDGGTTSQRVRDRVTVTTQVSESVDDHPDGPDDALDLRAVRRAQDANVETFGGFYYDREQDEFVVLVTNVAPPGWSDVKVPGHRVVTRSVAFALHELHAIRDDIIDLMRSDSGIYSVYTDVPSNVVVVGVQDGAAGAVGRELRSRFGDGVRVVDGAEVVPAACPRSDCSLSFQGGIRIQSSTGANCTTSWMFAGSRGTPQGNIPEHFIMTAGHCATLTAQGLTWSHPSGATYGPLYGWLSWYGDVGVVDIEDDATSKFWVAGEPTPQRTLQTIQSVSDEVIGYTSLCASGANSQDKYCGELLAIDVNATLDGELIGDLRQSSIPTCDTDDGIPDCGVAPGIRQGDSGGPVFYNYEARGIVHGFFETGPNANRLLYTQVKKARNVEGEYASGAYYVGFDHYCTANNPC